MTMKPALPVAVERPVNQTVLQKASEVTEIALVTGELGLLARKLYNILLEHAQPNMLTKEVHIIPFRLIIQKLDYRSNDYEAVKRALTSLPTTQVRWDYLDRGDIKARDKSARGRDFGVSAFVSQVVFDSEFVKYAYPPFLRELLHTPQRFAIVNLRIQNQFSGSYSLALYEIATQYLSSGVTGVYEVERWRGLLGIDPKDSGIYSQFKYFRSKVIVPATSEINQSTDIVIDPQFHRTGRNVTHISFSVKVNRQLPLGLTMHPQHAPIVERMIALGFTRPQAEEALREYEMDYIDGNLRVVEAKDAAGAIKSNVAGYLAQALKKDYRPKVTAKELTASAARREHHVRDAAMRQVQALEAQFMSALNDSIDHQIQRMSDEERTRAEEDFAKQMELDNNGFVLKKFRESGLKSQIVKVAFRSFVGPQLGYSNRDQLRRQYMKAHGSKQVAQRAA
jgi:hypothetical protein